MQLIAPSLVLFAISTFSMVIGIDLNNPLLQAREILSGEDASMKITTYQYPQCMGEEHYFYDVHYDAPIQSVFQSYKLSRDLDPSEQLDFSTFETSSQDPRGESSPCAKYKWTAPNAQKGGLCCTTEEVACLRIWHH